MFHYVDYFELQHAYISFHLVYLSLSLLFSISLSLTIYLSSSFLFSFSIFSFAPQSNQPNKIKQEQYGLPHLIFVIKLLFETVIHLAFIHFLLPFQSNFSSKQSKAIQSIEHNFLFLLGNKTPSRPVLCQGSPNL
jgi:hypothetical protein